MTEILARPLTWLLSMCCGLLGSHIVAITVFTFLTKMIVFPISLWVQRNGIKMVQLMPELNHLQIEYYGDKDTIAEETQALYKREHYHPLASTIPMFIQLALLIGIIEAVKQLLGTADSVLSAVPAQMGGATLLMPVAAGISALILSLAQSRLNPLQREQALSGQVMTGLFSIVLSLVLGAFVSLGVGVYWICSNLFTIVQQIVLNAVMKPEKYINYTALEESRKELQPILDLGSKISSEDKKREKADYKRFFSVANKHLVFYSEKSGFYKYFQNVIEYLLAHSNIIIHYVTSDPNDQVFRLAETHPRIRPYYIGEQKLITLMMKMDADMVVMTMPDLETYHIKRSYVRNDIEYVYMFHGVLVGMQTLRPGALDHFDTCLCVSNVQIAEIRQIEQSTGVKSKNLVACGYGVIDAMAEEYLATPKKTNRNILIAPSWQEQNILESCLPDLAVLLVAAGYDVMVRPHPQYMRRFPQKLSEIKEACMRCLPAEKFCFEDDFSSNQTVFNASLLITDWSSIGFEYTLATCKPALFINTPMKIINHNLIEHTTEDQEIPLNILLRNVVGIALEPEQLAQRLIPTVSHLLAEQSAYAKTIASVRAQQVAHFGESGKYCGQYIIQALKGRKDDKAVHR